MTRTSTNDELTRIPGLTIVANFTVMSSQVAVFRDRLASVTEKNAILDTLYRNFSCVRFHVFTTLFDIPVRFPFSMSSGNKRLLATETSLYELHSSRLRVSYVRYALPCTMIVESQFIASISMNVNRLFDNEYFFDSNGTARWIRNDPQSGSSVVGRVVEIRANDRT